MAPLHELHRRHRTIRARPFGATIILGLFASGRAFPQTPALHPQPAVELAWSAPLGCPSTETIRAEIESLVAQDDSLQEAPRPTLSAGATVTANDGHWTMLVRIDTEHASERKSVQGEDCATLADAFAVMVALVLDPAMPGRSGLRQPSATPPGLDGRPARARTTGAETPPKRRFWFAGPVAAAAYGSLPSPAFGFGARIALETSIRWEVGARLWPDRTASVALPSGESIGGRIRLLSFQPAICIPFSNGTWAGCAGADIGAMRAQGPDNPITDIAYTSGNSVWLAPTLGAALTVPVARFLEFNFRADLGVPIFRPKFLVEHAQGQASVAVFQPAPVFAVITVSPEFRFFSTDSSEAGHPLP